MVAVVVEKMGAVVEKMGAVVAEKMGVVLGIVVVAKMCRYVVRPFVVVVVVKKSWK